MVHDPRDLLVVIVKILNKVGIPYLVTGGVAILAWGRPRFTADLDLVVELQVEHIDRLVRSLRALHKVGYIDEEAVQEAVKQRDEFNFVDSATGVKVDFWVSQGDAFDQSRFARRMKKQIVGYPVWFSSPEDLILIKLRWYQSSLSWRQLDDIISILKIQEDKLDHKYLTDWVHKLGLEKEWDFARKHEIL